LSQKEGERRTKQLRSKQQPLSEQGFKLGSGDSTQNESRRNPITQAIMTICTFAIAQVQMLTKKTRPFIETIMHGNKILALYDSGADISCLSETEFRRIPIQLRPSLKIGNTVKCKSASGQELKIKGVYSITINILGRMIEHPFRVMKNLNEKMIIGSDFIHKHLLAYDPALQKVFWQNQNEWQYAMAVTTHAIAIPSMTSRFITVNCIRENSAKIDSRKDVLINISASDPFLVGGPTLSKLDDKGEALMEVINCGPDIVYLDKNAPIGLAENAANFEFGDMLKDEVINSVRRVKSPATGDCKKMLEQLAQIPVDDANVKKRYMDLLVEHNDVFSLEKSDLGRSNTLLHEIHLKTPEPIYVKQFKIPEAHQDYLQEQVKEWLKLGIIQSSRSRYNSPLFLVAKKDGGY
jgi:hypothetical protein